VKNTDFTPSEMQECGPDFKIKPKRIALVSHKFSKESPNGKNSFSSFDYFKKIAKVCEDEGCDTILYALYSFDRANSKRTRNNLFFGTTKHIKNVIIESWDSSGKTDSWVEVWNREHPKPHIHFQRFGLSTQFKDMKAFMDNLPHRTHGKSIIILCGESNIIQTKRKGPDEYDDHCGIVKELNSKGVKFILNPIHDYMRRYEMKLKRNILSRQKRYVFSVWNWGKKGESRIGPWTVSYDGKDITESNVQEIHPPPIIERPDIRIGLFSTL